MLNKRSIEKELEEYKQKYVDEHNQVKRLLKGYEGVMNTIKPYLSDFTGINDGGQFDISLAVKEIIKSHEESYTALEDKYNRLLDKLQRISNYNH